MKPIDFERQFQLYALSYIRSHPGLTEDEIEERYNEMLSQWLNAPADWLDGAAPGAYFDSFTNAAELAELLRAYVSAGIAIPEPLYARLRALFPDAEKPLLTLFEDATAPEDARATALSLLAEAGSTSAASACAEFIRVQEAEGNLAEAACRYLISCGEAARMALLSAAENATSIGLEMLLDVLSNLPADDRVYELVRGAFVAFPDRRAFYANLLARLGDPRAVPLLKQAAMATDLNYLDYMEIENALEMLGEDIDPSREFYGDQDYEAMRRYE